MPPNHVIDNHHETLADHLRPRMINADELRMVSAYFSIYGYALLENELGTIGRVRFLFGEPDSAADLDPGKQEFKSFEMTETGLSPRHQLQQKHLALRCADWIRSNVEVRSIKQVNFLHGKMYLTETRDGGDAVVGSSNFTKRGLGGAADANLEINLAVGAEPPGAWLDLKQWFDALWRDTGRTRDAKDDVLKALARVGRDYAPEFVYYKTLYELFRSELEAQRAGESDLQTRLYDTGIWRTLYDFQKDAAKTVITRLERQGGCILADSVGLGKTYTALAVIKYYELRFNARVLVLCPKKLNENWILYPAANARKQNPFMDDRFAFTVLSHTDLSRSSGEAGSINLADFDWSGFHLVVIDESHNFRNATAGRKDNQGNVVKMSRYERLLEEVIAKGGDTKVLMLSATPVNTSLTDLRNQIDLMTNKREDSFHETLGIGNFRNLLDAAQRKFKTWETRNRTRDKTSLVEELGADFFNLLARVSIARSRRQIKKFYAESMREIGSFPSHEVPENRYPPTDLQGGLSYKLLNDQISSFSLSIYNPSAYVLSEDVLRDLQQEKEKYRFNQADREKFLIGMIRTNFLKRLESSARSLALTLERTVAKIDDLAAKIDEFDRNRTELDIETDVTPEDDEDDEEFLVNRGRHPFHLKDLDRSRWKDDLLRDRAVLDKARRSVELVTPDRDGKLAAVVEDVRRRASRPTTDKDGRTNRKLLIFTTFKDTAEYLYENLEPVARESNLTVAMVAGDVVRAPEGPSDFQTILARFAPRARGIHNEKNELDLLIATDCISEGQNLQDCDTVLNYDIHWNPVRLIQRFGRIDRIGSRSQSVRMINYWPTNDMELYLNLRHRVQARMALADAAATGDENRLAGDAEEQAQMELNFRDEQLKQLKNEIIDLDDMADSVVISDFTLDYFLSQLLRYLEHNRKELEAAPNGIYAVTQAEEGNPRSGVLFLLRQRNVADGDGARHVSLTSPWFLVFMRDDGTVGLSHIKARQALDLFERVAAGQVESLQELCDAFDAETRQGRDMSRYDALLEIAVTSIVGQFKEVVRQHVGKRGFTIPKKVEQPAELDDFELVTWLIVRNGT